MKFQSRHFPLDYDVLSKYYSSSIYDSKKAMKLSSREAMGMGMWKLLTSASRKEEIAKSVSAFMALDFIATSLDCSSILL
jgi:hypothetical protein